MHSLSRNGALTDLDNQDTYGMPVLQHSNVPPGYIADMQAKALLVFGVARAPAVLINGKPYGGPVGSVWIDGQAAHVVPLYGERLEAVLDGMAERFAAAQRALAAAVGQ